MLQGSVILGDAHRIGSCNQRGRGGKNDILRLRRNVGQRGCGGGGDERRVMVLPDGNHIQTDFFCLLGDFDDVLLTFVFADGLARNRVGRDVANAKDTELHDFCPFSTLHSSCTALTLLLDSYLVKYM